MRITLPSFAKINWNLKVLGKRPDGFHDLVTVFQTVELHDDITFEPAETPQVSLQVEGLTVEAGEQNLVLKAARLLQNRAGAKAGASIQLRKRIPVGGGLGGGSSNAAMTLLALNQLWNCGFSKAQLLGLGAALGSDVPFFFIGGTAFGLGRGEEIIPREDFADPQPVVLLFSPGFSIPTAEAYVRADFPHLKEVTSGLTPRTMDTKIQRLHAVLKARDWRRLKNDLEESVFFNYSVLANLKACLLEHGCEHVILCGSGSTLLAMGEEEALRTSGQRCQSQMRGNFRVSRSLPRGRYKQILKRSTLNLEI